MLKLKLVTPPELEPVTLNQVKAQLKFDVSDYSPDDDINDLIPAAREWCQEYQNRAYITQTFELALDAWPCSNSIVLPRPPLQNIVSVGYTDNAGVTTIWSASNYVADDYSEPAKLVKAYSKLWPSVYLDVANGIVIQYTAGYGLTPTDVPARIKRAIILLVSFWFENGICEPPQGIKSLLSLDRVVPV
jgi:uncharacterized phiE125 gp8 family phage protein